jgi:hypothetical protein
MSGLSAAEAQALFLLVGPAAAVSTRRSRRCEDSCGHCRRPSGARRDPPAEGPPTYTNSARQRTERLVDPWGLVDKDEI